MARKKETTIANKKSVNPGIKKLKLLVTIVVLTLTGINSFNS